MRYSGTKEWIIQISPIQKIILPDWSWVGSKGHWSYSKHFGGEGIHTKSKLFLQQCWNVVAFHSSCHAVFSSYMIHASWFSQHQPSVQQAELSSDTDCQRFMWTSGLRIQSLRLPISDSVHINGEPGDPHFCSAGYRWGSDLPCPFWQFIRTTQKTKGNPL